MSSRPQPAQNTVLGTSCSSQQVGYWDEGSRALQSHPLLANPREPPPTQPKPRVSRSSSFGSPGSYHTCLCLFPKVISLKEGDFFFDSLRQVSDWVKKNRPQKEGEGHLCGGAAAC